MTSIDIWFKFLSECKNYNYNYSLLEINERARALQFLKEIDCRRFVISRGKLKQILSSYLNLPPDKISFATELQGKPYVAGEKAGILKFNLSHSDNYLLVGVVRCAYEIGVDIERWTDSIDYEGVLDLCFSQSERSFWRDLPADQKQAFFYRQWVRKESFVKAVGLGLALDVSQVETTLTGASRFLSLPVDCGLPEDWSLIDLKLPAGISGAITIQSPNLPSINYKSLL
jgi:4'-phosphopantetheinyl transferase